MDDGFCKGLFFIYEDDYGIFALEVIHVINYICWFIYTELSLYLWNEVYFIVIF